jgi:hypothetical protein
MNNEITVEKAEIAGGLLAGMNRTYALEIKRAEVENMLSHGSVRTELRIIETKNFDQIPLDEDSKD